MQGVSIELTSIYQSMDVEGKCITEKTQTCFLWIFEWIIVKFTGSGILKKCRFKTERERNP